MQAATVHVSFDASSEDAAPADADDDGAPGSACGLVLRCEKARQSPESSAESIRRPDLTRGVDDSQVALIKLHERLFFPKEVEASSLTIALRLNGHCVFAYGTDGRCDHYVIAAQSLFNHGVITI